MITNYNKYVGLSQRQVGPIDGPYRERIVKAIIERGRSVAEMSNQLKISSSAIYRWIEEYKAANNKIDNKKIEGAVEGDTSAKPEVNPVSESNTSKKRYTYSTVEHRKEMVKKCHESFNEKSVQQFAEIENIPFQTMHTWIQRYKKELGLEFRKMGKKQREKFRMAKSGGYNINDMSKNTTELEDTKQVVNEIENAWQNRYKKDEDNIRDLLKNEQAVIENQLKQKVNESKENVKPVASWEEELKLKLMEAENKILREMMNSITKGGR